MPYLAIFTGIVGVWLPWLLHVSLEWKFNPQYGYGWSVPLLALVLAWQRRGDWMGAVDKEFTIGKSVVAQWITLSSLAVWLAVGRVVSIANPDWRLVGWWLGLGAAGGGLWVMWRMWGGRAMSVMSFALIFPLVATPWPSGIEDSLVGLLRQLVTMIAVEASAWLGHPAMRSGNLIVTTGGILGVNEACSGIRSLQSGLMAALFLGEFYRLKIGRRVALVVVAVVAAVLLNMARATLLVIVASKSGVERTGGLSAHDPAGWLVFAVLFVILFWLTWRWGMGGEEVRIAGSKIADCLQALERKPCMLMSGLGAGMVVCAFAALVLGYVWFEARLGDVAREEQLGLNETGDGFQRQDIDGEIRRQLRYDWGVSAEWIGELGERWQVYVFDWTGGATAAFLSRAHSPEVCVPAAGLPVNGEAETVVAQISGRPIAFQHQQFGQGDARLDVFHFTSGWREEKSWEHDSPWSVSTRLRLARSGVRQSSAQSLIVGVSGLPADVSPQKIFLRGVERTFLIKASH